MVCWPRIRHITNVTHGMGHTNMTGLSGKPGHVVHMFPLSPYPILHNIDLLQAAVEDAIILLKNPLTETFAGTMENRQQAQLINFFNTLNQEDQPWLKPKAKCLTQNHDDNQGAPALGVPVGNRGTACN